MNKSRTVYVCQECGSINPKWSGKCNDCGAWNSLHEEIIEASKKKLVNIKENISLETLDGSTTDNKV